MSIIGLVSGGEGVFASAVQRRDGHVETFTLTHPRWLKLFATAVRSFQTLVAALAADIVGGVLWASRVLTALKRVFGGVDSAFLLL